MNQEGVQSHIPGYSPDEYINSPLVAGLNKDNYDKFVKEFDISLVFFYDPTNANSRGPAMQIRKAASATQRETHAYGAVNCTVDKEICDKQNARINIPYFRFFFRRGELSIVTVPGLESEIIQQYMETAEPESI